ncbi:MAG: hypothetical protein HKO81_05670 [Flavobacteriaceae bacterium]|nr:hypothetical protein [Flavobacteriaceae bacterium]
MCKQRGHEVVKRLDVSADRNSDSRKLRYPKRAKVRFGKGSNEIYVVGYASELQLMSHQGKQFN